MNRLLSMIVVPLIAAGLAGSARGATRAGNDFDSRLAGYPQLTILLTDERLESPASVAAGLTVLVEDNATDAPGHAFVLRIPDDISEAEVSEALTGPPLEQEIPDWFWRAEFLGNADSAAPGESSISLIDLMPGRYLAGDPFRPRSEYARFEVSDAASPNSPRLDATDASLELFEMGFGLPENVRPGVALWEVHNNGAIPHEFAIVPVPAGATRADFAAAATAMLAAELSGDATAARAEIDALGGEWAGWSGEAVAGMGVLSPRRISVVQIALEPGTYGIVCYVPDPVSGTSHLMLGMSDVFTVIGD